VLRTVVALAILLLYFAVVVEGIARGVYGPAVTAMIPVVMIAAGFLLGRDMVDIFIERKQVKKVREEKRTEKGEDVNGAE
jgi:hypothetical protein